MKRNRLTALAAACSLVIAPSIATAHPGHGVQPDGTAGHMLEHAVMLALILLGIFALIWFWRSYHRR